MPTLAVLHSPDAGQTFYYVAQGNGTAQLNVAAFQETGVTMATGEKVYGRNPGGAAGPPPQPPQSALDLFAAQLARITTAWYASRDPASFASGSYLVEWNQEHPGATGFCVLKTV